MLHKLEELWLLQPSTRRDRLLGTLPFYLLFLAQLIHHEVWRDEINAWAISYVSQSLPELLHRVHYEAHPALWYILLFAASRVSSALWMLKLVEALIGTGTYFLIAWWGPFRRLELLLLLTGYYLTFEYTVQIRMYSLALLFTLAYAASRSYRPDRVWGNAIWLGLLANTDITAALLAGGLALEYAVAILTDRELPRSRKRRDLAGGIAIFSAFLALSLATLWPSQDIGWSTTGRLFSHFWDVHQLFQSVARWVAVPWLPHSINMVQEWIPAGWPYFLFLPFALLFLCLAFRGNGRVGLIVASVCMAGTLFSQITRVGAIRHTGMVYIAFIVALWLLRAWNRPVSPWAYVLLGLTSVTGVIATIDQWSWPYVDTGAAAAWIRQQGMDDLPLFDTPDTDALGVPERLHRPVYQLACECDDTVLTFAKRRDGFRQEYDIPSRLVRGFRAKNVPAALFLITHPLQPWELRELTARGVHNELIAHFTRGFISDEYIYIYRLSGDPARNGPPAW